MTGWNIGGQGGNSFPFDNPGDYVRGKVVDLAEVQQTDPKTGAPQFWDNGDKKMQFRITLQTELRDFQKDPNDQGLRDIYVRGSKTPDDDGMSSLCAVLTAVKEATGGQTEIKYGADLCLMYDHDGRQANRAFSAPKKYVAWYTPPSVELDQPPNARQPGQPPGQPWGPGAQGNNQPAGQPGAQGNYQQGGQQGPPPGNYGGGGGGGVSYPPPQTGGGGGGGQWSQSGPPPGAGNAQRPSGPPPGVAQGNQQQGPPGNPAINQRVAEEYAYNPQAQRPADGGPPPGAGHQSNQWPPQDNGPGPGWANEPPANDPWGPPQNDPWADNWAPGTQGAQSNQAQTDAWTSQPSAAHAEGMNQFATRQVDQQAPQQGANGNDGPLTRARVQHVIDLGQDPNQVYGYGWEQRVQG